MSYPRMFSALSLVVLAGCPREGPPPVADPELFAPMLNGMGRYAMPISTDDPLAQRYFDQGMVLHYAFNHAEAARSFRQAAALDPECAMCAWGLALTLGPNINAPMDPDDVPEAWAAIQRAQQLAPGVPEEERAWIAALAPRYGPEPLEDRTPLDEAYAEAMRDLASQRPDDADVLSLLGEALMVLHPWDYWGAQGEPQAWTPEILGVLEAAMEADPAHPMANHLYVHAVEASPRPELGLPAAERLKGLVPGAGHLVHMPAHILMRVGRYHDAVEANQRAIVADEAYLSQVRPEGLYPSAYAPHNAHFLWVAAALGGEREVAHQAAERVRDAVSPEQMREEGWGTLQHYWVTPLFAAVRFADWARVLSHERPPEDLRYPNAVWHFARGMALADRGDLDAAETELEAVRTILEQDREALAEVTVWDLNASTDLVAIAEAMLAGTLAAARGDVDRAVSELTRAVALEDALTYDEPPSWPLPVRHALGAVLLDAGRYAEAEAVFRQDLERFPANGWALLGLEQALRGQDDDAAADREARRREIAWAWADVPLVTPGYRAARAPQD